jgi:hypothetical protein
MAKYDPTVLQTYADRLYAKAAWITAKCVVIGALIGFAIATAPAILLQNRIDERIESRYKGTGNDFIVPPQEPNNGSDFVSGVLGLGAVVGLLTGFSIGQRKAFEYRLQAQLTLCQVRIESNTRQGVMSHASGS